MLLYNTLPCKKTARATGGGRKKYKPTKLGGGGETEKIQNLMFANLAGVIR